MMEKKIIVAIVLIAAALGFFLYASHTSFSLFLLIIILAGMNEFYQMVFPQKEYAFKMFGFLITSLVVADIYFVNSSFVSALLVLVLPLYFLLYIKEKDNQRFISNLGMLLLGILYIPFCFSHAILLHEMEIGKKGLFFLCVTIWSFDSFAYLVGSLSGKIKLAPHISSGKTLEGFIAGVLAGIILCLPYRFLFFRELALQHTLIISLSLCFLSQLGDLFESRIKRCFGFKDSSHLFPGHGGILDRIDSFAFSTPFLYYYLRIYGFK